MKIFSNFMFTQTMARCKVAIRDVPFFWNSYSFGKFQLTILNIYSQAVQRKRSPPTAVTSVASVETRRRGRPPLLGHSPPRTPRAHEQTFRRDARGLSPVENFTSLLSNERRGGVLEASRT